MEAEHWLETLNALKSAAKSGEISEARINDAVTRIIRVKLELGLFEKPLGDTALIKNAFASEEHKEVAKSAVRESLVLLKNKNNALPIKSGTKVFVSGPASDSVGLQCGGWTLDWQGNKRQPSGETILAGFKNIASEYSNEIITESSKAHQADLSIVVIGEESYAEFMGDDASLSLEEDLALKDNLKALEFAYSLKKPVIVILVSGRPRIVTEEITKWDAFVAAWLPGSEGSAVAEVLYGKYNFKGKLPVSWPKDVTTIPSKLPEDVLFSIGFGLE
jgi:beta-glucosidase